MVLWLLEDTHGQELCVRFHLLKNLSDETQKKGWDGSYLKLMTDQSRGNFYHSKGKFNPVPQVPRMIITKQNAQREKVVYKDNNIFCLKTIWK